MEVTELKSQEMRKLAPELDPLRIGTGWKPEDLEKPQVMIESTFGDSHPGSGHLDILVGKCVKEWSRPAGMGHAITARISATGRVRERTGLISVWPAVK